MYGECWCMVGTWDVVWVMYGGWGVVGRWGVVRWMGCYVVDDVLCDG